MTTFTPDRFKDRTAIVTGAGSGIGRATAVRLANEGARVIATDISEDRLDDLVAELKELPVTPVAGDITSTDVIDACVSAAGDRVDHLVNNAGIMDAFLPVADVDDATWDAVLAVNLTAPMRLTRAVVPTMIDQGGGSIVNVGSEASLHTVSGVAYAASKHALDGLTKNTGFFYGPKGVRCNAVLPGPVETNIVDSDDVEGAYGSEWAKERIGPIMEATMPGWAQSEQIAAAITWLLSDESSNINGVLLPSDDGWSAL